MEHGEKVEKISIHRFRRLAQRGIAATKTEKNWTTNYANYTNKMIKDPLSADYADSRR
jgi:hypothetical protein